jgi:hypothetical protein
MVMRFKQFLKEAIFMIRKGDIRIVYTGTLDPDAVYQGFPSYYYDSNHGWMQEWLDNGTKLEFKTLRDLKTEHYAEVSDFADHHAAWLLEEVAAVKLQYPDGFGQGVEFYIDPKDLEKKTVDEAAYKKIVRDWMNSLKEATGPRLKGKKKSSYRSSCKHYVRYVDRCTTHFGLHGCHEHSRTA